MKKFLLSLLILAYPTNAYSAVCTPFEAAVFKLVDEAQAFQHTKSFKEYGWSSAGPTNNWLPRFQETRNQEKGLQFMRDYGFLLAEAYQVADEYRTTGFLDDFYKEIEANIQNSTRCKY